jgi:hypothetical protein
MLSLIAISRLRAVARQQQIGSVRARNRQDQPTTSTARTGLEYSRRGCRFRLRLPEQKLREIRPLTVVAVLATSGGRVAPEWPAPEQG